MICPYCGSELVWDDYFGRYTGKGISGIEKRGDIFRCENAKCESEKFNFYFWNTTEDNNLKNGYPC